MAPKKPKVSIIYDDPWKNAYWFARMLINNDKYGAVGKNTSFLVTLATRLRFIIDDETVTDSEEKVRLCQRAITNEVLLKFKKATKKLERLNLFCSDINVLIHTIEDVKVFILTLESIMIPTNQYLTHVPSNDREFAEATARTYLDELGPKGLASVLILWDDLGVNGCLTAERLLIVQAFAELRHLIKDFSETQENEILTAFVQEFERRLGQKRKSRAGGSLEDVASFLFTYYGVEAAQKPEHFQADIEVDKWFKCKDGWLIGISCKRTLRERWKQVTSADRGVLSKFKIKQIWHLVTYDEDLSDEKIALLGGLDHIIYLRDDSRILSAAHTNIGLTRYVRKMSGFVHDIRHEQGIEPL